MPDSDQRRKDLMESNRPSQLRNHQLQKTAFVYSRVSTKEQAEHSRGSLAAQEDQTRRALEDEYPLQRIRFVDSDVGVSGKFMANRVGIAEVGDAVRAGEAGAIYVSAMDRLGRNDFESLGLIKDCIRCDVVIVENGTHYNPRDLRQLLGIKLPRRRMARIIPLP